ncbi:MAG: AAA family ATPase, partial [Gemmataceae bacterium]|nr:AAA family ATPase [Gemmataceae bacterium]
MKLRALEVADWACIEWLRLEDLPDGIIVLHGPNGIGKSSLVQALRSCLFDHDHTSQHSIITKAINWHSRRPPRVVVELEVRGRHCRLSKTFSKLREGGATLQERTAAGWTTLASGKEASATARALLGVDRSSAGLYQLLWLRQGEVALPEKLDGQLQQQIESLLGSLITGRDVEFKRRLDQACETWFTASMEERRVSPLTRLTDQLDQARQHLEEVERRRRELDDTLRLYDEARARRRQLQEDLAAAEREAEALAQAAVAVRERRHAHELARRDWERARQAAADLREQWTQLRGRIADLRQCQRQCDEAQAERESAQQRAEQAEAAAAQARRRWQEAQDRLRQHQRGQADLDERQLLVTLTAQRDKLRADVETARRLAARQKSLEAELAGPPVPSADEIETLRGYRLEAQRLQARLDAEAMRLTFHAERDAAFHAAVDDQPDQPGVVGTGAEVAWTVRHRAVLTLPGVGVVRLERAVQKHDLEETARSLARLQAAYATALVAAGMDPDHPTALDELTERRIHREVRTRELDEVRQRLRQAAPQGIDALLAAQAQAERGRIEVFQRHPDWQAWEATSEALDELRAEFARQAALREQESAAAEAACHDAEQRAAEAAANLQRCNIRAAEWKSRVEVLQTQFLQGDDLAALEERLRQAEAACVAAEQGVRATALTDDEQRIDEGVRAAEEAL